MAIVNKENIMSVLSVLASAVNAVNLYIQQANASGDGYVNLTSSIISIITLIFSAILIKVLKGEKIQLSTELETLSNQAQPSARVEINEPIAESQLTRSIGDLNEITVEETPRYIVYERSTKKASEVN